MEVLTKIASIGVLLTAVLGLISLPTMAFTAYNNIEKNYVYLGVVCAAAAVSFLVSVICVITMIIIY